MRAISSPTFVPVAALAGVLFFAAPAGANDVDPLDAFGGSAWPDYYVDSQLAEVPATAPVKERYLLLAQTDQAGIDDVNDPLEPMNRVFFCVQRICLHRVFGSGCEVIQLRCSGSSTYSTW